MPVESIGLTPISPVTADVGTVDIPDFARITKLPAVPRFTGACAAVASWRKHITVTGHSRGGKCALLAGAADERIALTVPNNSGCGGSGCYRLQADKSEDIAVITKNFPFWFAPRFKDFIGRVERLPFDQHTVKALVAPRALLTTEALGDLWANPLGTQQSNAAAREVFDFLGATDKIGIYFRPGGHEHNADDWSVLLDFADQQLLGKKVPRDFGKSAFSDAAKGYSWARPE